MSLLTESLHGSRLLRPLCRLSEISGRKFTEWLHAAGWAQGVEATLRPLDQVCQTIGKQALIRLLFNPILLCSGLLLLFSSATVLDTGPVGLLTWALFLYAILMAAFRPECRIQRITLIDGLVILFFMTVLIATAFSSYRLTSLKGLEKMMTFLAGYCVFRTALEQKTLDLQRIRIPILLIFLGLFTFLAFGESLIGFYQHLHHIQPLATWEDPSVNAELKMTRIFGTLKPSNPNLLAGFLTPCFAAAIGLGLYSGLASFGNNGPLPGKQKWLLRLLALICCLCGVIILVAIGMTGSRGGYLAIATMLVTLFAVTGHLFWHHEGIKTVKTFKVLWLLVLFGSIGAILAAFLMSGQLQHRIASIFAMREDTSIAYRLNVYHSALHMIHDNPIFGIGPGNETFKLVYGLYMVPGFNALGSYSVPLEITVEQGIVGLISFVVLLSAIFMRLLLFSDSNRDLDEKILVAILFAGIVGSLVYGIFDTIWYRPAVNLLFWWMVAGFASLAENYFSSPKLTTK